MLFGVGFLHLLGPQKYVSQEPVGAFEKFWIKIMHTLGVQVVFGVLQFLFIGSFPPPHALKGRRPASSHTALLVLQFFLTTLFVRVPTHKGALHRVYLTYSRPALSSQPSGSLVPLYWSSVIVVVLVVSIRGVPICWPPPSPVAPSIR